NRHGEVPGRDQGGDAQRHARGHADFIGELGGRGLAVEPAALAGHEVEHIDGFLDIAAGLDQHLAHLARHGGGELLLAGDQQLGGAIEDLGAARGGSGAPCGIGGSGGGTGLPAIRFWSETASGMRFQCTVGRAAGGSAGYSMLERHMAQGLTTTEAAFIEAAQRNGDMYIHQPYELYSEGNHEAWRRLFARMQAQWRQHATPQFLKGIDSLCFDATRVPRLEEVNEFLQPLTGFRAKAVSGYVPAFDFFDCLSKREFPTTITI